MDECGRATGLACLFTLAPTLPDYSATVATLAGVVALLVAVAAFVRPVRYSALFSRSGSGLRK
jgi:hypothetical protein